jgi:hypothetical protein
MIASTVHGMNDIKKPDNQLITNSHNIMTINVDSLDAKLYAM